MLEIVSYDFIIGLPVSLIWSLMHEHVTGGDKYQHLMKGKILVSRFNVHHAKGLSHLWNDSCLL